VTQFASGAYPADWAEVSRAAKCRAAWRCERCGHPDDPAACRDAGVRRGRLPCDEHCTHREDGKQRVLTVHHLNGDKSCCEPFNLAVLCQVCHLSVQARIVFDRPYLLPHTPWMARHVEAFKRASAQRTGREPLPFSGEWLP
jgi:hypothetical protein